MKTTCLPALTVLFATLLAANGQNSGFTVNNMHRLTGFGTSERFGSRFYAFIEGDDITSTDPVSSASFTGPGISGSLSFDMNRWRFQDDRIGPVNPAAVHFQQGNYTLNADGNTTSLDLTGGFPNIPLILGSNAGRWQDGILILSAEESDSDLILTTNSSNGNGFVSIELGSVPNFDPDEFINSGYNDGDIGDDIEDGVTLSVENSTLGIQGGTLKPGRYYIGEFEFDEVLDSKFANGIGGTAFALNSSTTLIAIHVENRILPVEAVWTGPKKGRFDFETEPGFNYRLKRSTDLGFGSSTEIAMVSGNGSSTSLSFDESGSTDEKAFFRVEREELATAPDAAAFADLMEGKTIRGYNLKAGNRWEWFGYEGTWSYEVTSGQVGLLTLSWDDFPDEEDLIELDFGTDGDRTEVAYDYSFGGNGVGVKRETGLVDLTQNSFAPFGLVFPDLLEGQTYLGYRFLPGGNRFIWDESETGNYSWSLVGDDQVKLVFTYDEDGNNPAIYREEVTITFNGTSEVPLHYELYEADVLESSQAAGTITLTVAD